MLYLRALMLIIFSFSGDFCQAQNAGNLKLWYQQPAGEVWENALPIGNGKLGAMVYGNVSNETIQLNEHTVWSGSPNRNDNPKALAVLDQVQEAIFADRYKEAEKLVQENFISKKSHGQKFQPVGALHLRFHGHSSYDNYYRELDIEKAMSKVSYEVEGTTYTREVFASLADDVIMIHLTTSDSSSLNFTLSVSSPHTKKEISVNDHEVMIKGITGDHEGVKSEVKFYSIARIMPEGGSIIANDTSLVISGANAATILVSIGTNFINFQDLGGDEIKAASIPLKNAVQKTFPQLRSDQINAYQKFFNRVSLDLGRTSAADLPTDVRLQNFNSTYDPHFVTLYYQFGRYLLISASQPGGQPANLQGIWNHRMDPPWDSKYTVNINAEMNYWPAEKTNLSELHEPLIELIRELSIAGQQTAKSMYGARGWMAHHNTDIWRATGAIDGAFWGMWTSGGGWLTQHLWEHYLYSGDKDYLASVYPVLKGASTFYLDFLVEDPHSKYLVACPSNSPENAPQEHAGVSVDAGTTMDNQIIFDVFSSTIEAAEILDIDPEFVDTLKGKRDRLPPMHIGKHNQLQEWLDDVDDPDDHHRHISHLYGLFPSNQISPYRTAELFEAAKNTLEQRGDISTGWSMGWKVNWWAKMLDGNHAYQLIKNQLTPLSEKPETGGTYNNLFDAHPPFQIDGNFGCTSGITEMLMQSSDGAIQILPALPDALPQGNIMGLRARGGFEIEELWWEEGKLQKLVIKSHLGGNLRLRTYTEISQENIADLKFAQGENPNPFYRVPVVKVPVISPLASMKMPELKKTFQYDVPTQSGESYIFYVK